MKKIQIKEEDKCQYGIIDGPIWQDACNHGPETYVCSFAVLKHGIRGVLKYDLYVFTESYFGNEVCIRYGNEGHEYYSPGSLGNFMARSGIHINDEHAVAAKILSDLGRFAWEPRNPKGQNELGKS